MNIHIEASLKIEKHLGKREYTSIRIVLISLQMHFQLHLFILEAAI